MTADLTITQVARGAGLRPSAIRFYESMGLLPEPQRVAGRRRYDPTVWQRLAIIDLAQQAGFTVAEIRTFLHGFSEGTPPGTRWRTLAEQKLPQVEALLARAQKMRRILEAGMNCECLSLEQCASLACPAPPAP